MRDLEALAATGYRAATILADPPWPWESWGGFGKIHTAVDHHYGTMSIEQIAALPVLPLAADDSALLLWCTWPRLPAGLAVMSAWGFRYSTCAFVWVKQNESGAGLHTGNGYWTRSNSEVCLLGTRGSPHRLGLDVHQVVMAPIGEHSAKPDEVHDRIARLVAGPYLELFARRARRGWTTWGDEVPPPIATTVPAGETELRYVPHADVDSFAAQGWQRTSALDGTHHGHHAVLMRRPAVGDMPGIPDFLRRVPATATSQH